MSPHRKIFDLEEENVDDPRAPSGRRSRDRNDTITLEIAKIVIPVLLAWGLAIYTARTEAAEAVKTEVAIIKTTEQTHFDEIQRTLQRIDEWMIRQEEKEK